QRALAPILVLLFPEAPEPPDGGSRQPLGIRAEESGPGRAEVPGTDSLEVEPGDQFLDALGLAQVRRQDGRGKLLTLVRGTPVLHAGLLDLHRPNPGGDSSRRQVAIADNLAAALFVPAILVAVNPIGDFGLAGLGKELLRPA